jgi:hypothetical protein
VEIPGLRSWPSFRWGRLRWGFRLASQDAERIRCRARELARIEGRWRRWSQRPRKPPEPSGRDDAACQKCQEDVIHKEENVRARASEDCAMTSRTNSHMAEHNQRGETRPSPSALQQRRREVLERYLAGDPIAVICQELGCAKRWLYKWKKRYQATEPGWFQEHSRRPESTPTKTPDALEAEIVRLRQTLALDGAGPVSAAVIHDHLRHHSVASIPSRRTIYRILKRQAQEVTSHTCPS